MFEVDALQTGFKNWGVSVDLYKYCEEVVILKLVPVAYAQERLIFKNFM